MGRSKSRRPARRQSNAGAENVVAKGVVAPPFSQGVAAPTRPPLWALIVAVVAAFIAFGGAVGGPFQFDDVAAIARNPTIERLWPLSSALNPPPRTAVSGRPVVNYTLAINHAINSALGIDQQAGLKNSHAGASYRVVNILIHLITALLLFGLIRRTARRVPWPESWSLTPDRLAAAVTAVWLIHPLQTEAVAYAIQRTELLVSLFYLITLYASVRAWDASSARSRLWWYGAAIVGCLLGMASKEVMVSAPIVVMLYDRAFRAETWRDLLGRRGRLPFYLLLFAAMAPLVVSVISGARADSVGFQHGITWYQYLYSQAWAISRYLELALWPDKLAFDYGERIIHGLRGVPGLIGLSLLGVAVALLWKRITWLAFLGTWFFMLLAPSSSVVPIRTEIAAERRVYLALVPVFIVIAVGLEVLRGRIARLDESERKRTLVLLATSVGLVYCAVSAWTGTVIAAGIGGQGSRAVIAFVVRLAIGGLVGVVSWWLVTTKDRRWIVGVIGLALLARSAQRSSFYADPEALWSDAAAKYPENPRAYDNLAAAIIQGDSSRTDDAERLLRQAVSIDSSYLTGWTNLADIELRRGRTAEGRALLERALGLDPEFVDANERLGGVLVKLGETQRGITYLERATAFQPNDESLGTLAIAYLAVGRVDDAKAALLRVVALNPHRADALGYLGAMAAEAGRFDEAAAYIEAAIRAGATTAASYALLSHTYAQLQRADEAARAAALAAARAGDDANVYLQLGRAMMIAQRGVEAERYLARAVELDSKNPEAMTRLGLAKASNGQIAEATALFRRVLSMQPGYEPAQRALASVSPAARPK